MTPLDYILDDEWQRRTAGERVVGWIAGPDFHEECGYRWDQHDSRQVGPDGGWKGPFGCPSENAARAAYGDR